MADNDLSPAAPAPAHPMANPGYGKRSAPEQLPRGDGDFAHLPAREASIAALIDSLPHGAAMSAKALAAAHPRYGQAACLSALRRLSEAGHLRRSREHLVLPDGSRWVTRTYFSRTSRDDAWWQAALRGEASVPSDGAGGGPPPEAAARHPARSLAYEALADLGHRDPRLTLSAADCEALEPLAAQWLARDPSTDRFSGVLAAGLPPDVYSVRGLVQRRLQDKMPPERRPAPPAPPAPTRPPLRIMECTVCGTPGRPEDLPGGICAACRSQGRSAPKRRTATEAEVRAHAAGIRRAMRAIPRQAARTGGHHT